LHLVHHKFGTPPTDVKFSVSLAGRQTSFLIEFNSQDHHKPVFAGTVIV